MHKRCREIMDELILNGELEEITWFEFAPKQELKLKLKDMLEDEVDEKYLLSEKLVSYFEKHKEEQKEKGNGFGWQPLDKNSEISFTITNPGKTRPNETYIKLEQTHTLNIKGNDSIKMIYSSDGHNPSLTTMQGGHREPKVAIANGLIEVSDGVRVKEATKLGYKIAEEGDSINISVQSSKTRRGRVGKQVAQTLDTACNQVVFKKEIDEYEKWNKAGFIFRKLTERECFRLQGFDDSFIFPLKMSSTQLYKQAGNGMSRNILDMIFTQIFTFYTKHI